MKRLNILDLHRTINEKKEKHTVCFEKVLDMIHNKIKKSAHNKHVSCFYQVPTFVFGYPLFNINECIEYVSQQLKANGFFVQYYFPNKLYISWDFEEIDRNKNEKKKTQALQPVEKPRSILASNSLMKYKPSGKLELNLV